MRTTSICVLVLACLASMTLARPGGRGGRGGQGGRHDGYKGSLPTAEERLEHFEETLTRIPESYHVEARALFVEKEEILGDVTSLNDLTDEEQTEYDDVKGDMRDLLDEARFEQSIAFLSDADQITARQLQLEIANLLGDGDRRDLSDADRVIFDEKHDQLKELQRQSCFEGKVGELSAEDQASARELSDQIQTLVGDGTPCELSDEVRTTFDDLSEQLSTLLGDTRTHGPRCDRRSGRGGRGGRGGRH